MEKATQLFQAIELINRSKKFMRNEELSYLRKIDSSVLLAKAIYRLDSMMLKNAKPGKELMFPATALCCSIGRSISAEYLSKNPMPRSKEEAFFYKTGWFVLSAIADKGNNAEFKTIESEKISYSKRKDENGNIYIESETFENKDIFYIISNVDLFLKLALLMPLNLEESPTADRPTFDRPARWNGFVNRVAGKLGGKFSRRVKRSLSVRNASNERLFRLLDKQQNVKYTLNEELHDIYNELYAQNHPLFSFKGKGYDKTQLESREREVKNIMSISNKLRNDDRYKDQKHFYHYQRMDFRYRKYSTSLDFKPDGSKLSRSLHCLTPKKVNLQGLLYLLAALSSASGNDKSSRVARVHYAVEMLPKWLKWAENPIESADEWTDEDEIDNPYEFMSILLAVKNLYKYFEAGGKDSIEISVPVFLDAQNSGIAILSALARDINGMKATSLIKSDEIGDAYMVIVDYILPKIERASYKPISSDLRADLKRVDQTLRKAKESGDELKRLKAEQLKAEVYNANKEAILEGCAAFWSKFTKKQLRGVCKRPTLSIPYGAGVETNSGAIYGDFRNKKAFKGINTFYCDFLSELITEAFKEQFKRARRLMVKYQAKAKKMAERNQNYGFVVPFTNVLFEQEYRSNYTSQIQVFFNGKRFQPRVIVSDQGSVDLNDARNGASANSTHVVDAAFLNYFITTFDNDVFAIHDAFGVHCNQAHEAWTRLRLCLKNLLTIDILKDRVGITYFKRGKGKLDWIMNSEFCFA